MGILGGIITVGAGLSVISTVFRNLFFFIDSIIYSLIPLIYSMIYSLYDVTKIFDGNQIEQVLANFATTIYSFLAIFMFFRIAFSLITMLVDPSVIDDKEKGAKKIVMNVMICLLLIVVVPKVFDYAKIIQSKILEERLVEKVIMGSEYTEEQAYSVGNELSLAVFKIFLTLNDSASPSAVNAYNNVFNTKTENISSLATYIDDMSISSGSIYSLHYTYLLSTIVGGYVLWVFIQMMIDVAYRALKFIALEILSPIAIVSYIDPKSGKSGVFSKWLNETVKTYISLFIRIFVYALVAVLLSMFDMSSLDGNVMQYIFFILALIAFIKTAPKFIDNLFGTTMSKDSDTKFAGNILKGLMGGAVVGGASLASAAVMSRGMAGVNRAKTMLGATWKGATKGYSSASKNGFRGVVGSTYDSYKGIQKDTGTMDFWTRQENRANAEMSDRVEDARDLNKNPDVARFIRRDASGVPIRDNDGKVQTDVDAVKAWLENSKDENGNDKPVYKHIDANDQNVSYQLDKVDKKKGELEQLMKEGYSRKGAKLQMSLAELQRDAALDQMELDAINSEIAQRQRERASVSYDTAVARGCSVEANGVYATEERALAAYRTNLEIKLADARSNPSANAQDIIDLEQRLNNITIDAANDSGYRVGTSDDKVFASKEDAVIAVAKNLENEVKNLVVEQQDVGQRVQKKKGSVDKKKAEIKAYHQEHQDDARIIERLQKGDRIRGRDKD